MSQDPTFLALGNSSQLQQLTKQSQQQFLANPQQLNSYSYALNNPIVKKDADGNFAVAALPVYAVWTAPQWVPWVIGGTVALISGLYLADQFPDPSTFKTGTLQNSRPFEHMGYPSGPQGPDDLKPPRDGLPTWQKLLYFGLGTGSLGYKLYDEYKQYESGVQNFTQPGNQYFGGNNATVQQRQNMVQNYNTNVGASTGGSGSTPSNNSLWVTPSGAVVTWGGSLVAGPVSK